jgi:MFS family permease
VLAILWLTGPDSFVIARMASATGFAPTTCVVACLGVTLTFVGVVVGLLFVTKAFIWCFLLAYVLLRLVGPTGIGATFALSLWTGVVADWAGKRRRNREKLI